LLAGAPGRIRTSDPQIRSLLPPIARPIGRAANRPGLYFGICLRRDDRPWPRPRCEILRLAAKLRHQARACGTAGAAPSAKSRRIGDNPVAGLTTAATPSALGDDAAQFRDVVGAASDYFKGGRCFILETGHKQDTNAPVNLVIVFLRIARCGILLTALGKQGCTHPLVQSRATGSTLILNHVAMGCMP
jgi:hypothetical protein